MLFKKGQNGNLIATKESDSDCYCMRTGINLLEKFGFLVSEDMEKQHVQNIVDVVLSIHVSFKEDK